ncbi:LOW QUALITY PROTEIN: hypothetical protein YC2023_074932 [Brassica napus]
MTRAPDLAVGPLRTWGTSACGATTVMPLDVLGRTRATLMYSMSSHLGRQAREFLVSASHQLALTTSLPFVHTARRYYRLNDPVKCSDHGTWVVHRLQRREKSTKPYHLEEGEVVTRIIVVTWKQNDLRTLKHHSRWPGFLADFVTTDSVLPDITNPGTKSVKEHSTKQPSFANRETVFVRKQCCNVKSKTTLGNEYLGSRIDEERSENVILGVNCIIPLAIESLNASCAPSLLAEDTSAWVSQIVVPPSSRGYRTEASLPCVTIRGWPKSELRMSGASLHAVVNSILVKLSVVSGQKLLMTQSPQRDPRQDHPLSLSISKSGGKETNKDSLSNGERTGKSLA